MLHYVQYKAVPTFLNYNEDWSVLWNLKSMKYIAIWIKCGHDNIKYMYVKDCLKTCFFSHRIVQYKIIKLLHHFSYITKH